MVCVQHTDLEKTASPVPSQEHVPSPGCPDDVSDCAARRGSRETKSDIVCSARVRSRCRLAVVNVVFSSSLFCLSSLRLSPCDLSVDTLVVHTISMGSWTACVFYSVCFDSCVLPNAFTYMCVSLCVCINEF